MMAGAADYSVHRSATISSAHMAATQSYQQVYEPAAAALKSLPSALTSARAVLNAVGDDVSDPATVQALTGALVQVSEMVDGGVVADFARVETYGNVFYTTTSVEPTKAEVDAALLSLVEAADAARDSHVEWATAERDSVVSRASTLADKIDGNVDHRLAALVETANAAESVGDIRNTTEALSAEIERAEASFKEWEQEQERIAAAQEKAAAEAAARQTASSASDSSSQSSSGSGSGSSTSSTPTTTATATYTEYVAYVGWQDEIDACQGSVLLSRISTRVVAEHWSCGGSNFPRTTGAIVTFTGQVSGTYRVVGMSKAYQYGNNKESGLPKGYDLMFQTCLYGDAQNTRYILLEKIG